MDFPLRSAFLALSLEGDAKRAFQDIQEQLRPWASILRFQNPQSPHLTLTFWREMMHIEYDEVREVAASIAERTDPFIVETTEMETFGDRRGDRVIYLAVQFSPELAAVKKLCPWPNDRPFSPHITVARIDHPQRFAVAKKKILRAAGRAQFPITFDRLRLYAEIDGVKQMQLEEFLFSEE